MDDPCLTISHIERLRDPRKIRSAMETHPATFIVFDVPYTDRDHTRETLMERKARLADIITPSKTITPTLYMDGVGVRLKKMTEERNWEGIVAKREGQHIPPGYAVVRLAQDKELEGNRRGDPWLPNGTAVWVNCWAPLPHRPQ